MHCSNFCRSNYFHQKSPKKEKVHEIVGVTTERISDDLTSPKLRPTRKNLDRGHVPKKSFHCVSGHINMAFVDLDG